MPRKLDNLDPAALASNPRADIRAWLRYEHIVLSAFHAHPTVFVYRPQTFEPSTVATRLRDAIRGKLAFDHPSSVSAESLLRWYSEIVIKNDGEYVYIGPAKAVTERLKGSPKVEGGLSFSKISLDEFHAFCLLLSNGRLQGPINVGKVDGIYAEEHLPANVEILPRPDGSIVLL